MSPRCLQVRAMGYACNPSILDAEERAHTLQVQPGLQKILRMGAEYKTAESRHPGEVTLDS